MDDNGRRQLTPLGSGCTLALHRDLALQVAAMTTTSVGDWQSERTLGPISLDLSLHLRPRCYERICQSATDTSVAFCLRDEMGKATTADGESVATTKERRELVKEARAALCSEEGLARVHKPRTEGRWCKLHA